MKGKTGKSQMRGGGMARKGMGAAMKNGGSAKKMKGGGISAALRQLSPIAMAVKGEYPKMGLLGMGDDLYKKAKKGGVKLEPGKSPDEVAAETGMKNGGKAKKMAMGGSPMGKARPPSMGGSANPPSDTPNMVKPRGLTPRGNDVRVTGTPNIGGTKSPIRPSSSIRPPLHDTPRVRPTGLPVNPSIRDASIGTGPRGVRGPKGGGLLGGGIKRLGMAPMKKGGMVKGKK